ncbi:cancer-related nucleoside-triphosphatase-like [Sciurus carolinensis]|uniref:cancer-related nucleoside-triphosphatase-like n=1 Tax=Sciurus carolinensis TaxID=30640 RepID=UPI001FB3B131|nr:cancer-related nucleoside-triphosphatase-like [Sciurus carolinensis]
MADVRNCAGNLSAEVKKKKGLGPRVCVIDEIGKMELFSQSFIQAVHQTLSSPATIILGTIPAPKGKPMALVEEIRVCVIDEIGKMELFSQPFIQAVHQTLSSPETMVLGTIPPRKGKPLALVGEIRGRPDVKVFSVTKENRNHLLPNIMAWVQSCGK